MPETENHLDINEEAKKSCDQVIDGPDHKTDSNRAPDDLNNKHDVHGEATVKDITVDNVQYRPDGKVATNIDSVKDIEKDDGGRCPGAPTPQKPPGVRAPGPKPSGGPPPPPGAGRGRGLPPPFLGSSSKKKISLKPLHWARLTRVSPTSLWVEPNGEEHIAQEFDVSEMNILFSATVQKRADKVTSENPSIIHLIELRRANNTEIMLTKVKIGLPDMRAAILEMDGTELNIDQIENLIKFCPTKDEMKLLKNYTGDQERLGKCEQFFLELMKVPRVETKLRVFYFKIQFDTKVTELRKSLKVVKSACEEIRNSEKLKEILKRILYLGNTLNQGTVKGAAVGFKLDGLLKLNDTRAANGKTTLMHYLCKVLASKASYLLDFHKDLESLESASKIQLKLLTEEKEAIKKGMEMLKWELAASESDDPVSEVFCKTLKDFIPIAHSKAYSAYILDFFVRKDADELSDYFSEDPQNCPFEQVTATLLDFIRLFKKAHKENIKQVELEKKKAAKEEGKRS